jgi:type II secretory pathway component PulK
VSRRRDRAGEEQGAILLLALGFIAFAGVVGMALAGYATTNLRATVNLRDLRARQFSADGVVDGAINTVRLDSAKGNVDSCFPAVTLNGMAYRVDCTSANSGTDVTFAACADTVTAPCPAASAVLLAAVHYTRTTTPATVQITSWSVRR